MKKLVSITVICIFCTLLSCDKQEKEFKEMPLNEIGSLIEVYKDSLSKVENEIIKEELNFKAEDSIIKFVNNLESKKWEGIYKFEKVDGVIVHYFVDFNNFRARDFASSNTNKSKYEIVKNLKDGDTVEIWGKFSELKGSDFPYKMGEYGILDIDFFMASDSIKRINDEKSVKIESDR